jgi:hypothetical protein
MPEWFMECFSVAYWALLFTTLVLGVYKRRELAFECAVLLFAMSLAYAMPLFFWFVFLFALCAVGTGVARRFPKKSAPRMTLEIALPVLLLLVAVVLGAKELARTNAVWPAFIMFGVSLVMLLLVRVSWPWTGLFVFVICAVFNVVWTRNIQHYEQVQQYMEILKADQNSDVYP